MRNGILSIAMVAAVTSLAMVGCDCKVDVAINDGIKPDTSAYTSVTLPSGAELLTYKAQQPDTSCKAVVIFPGGGYTHLAKNHEGKEIAAWMSANGVTAFVLLYNMPQGNPSVPNTDAREAFEYARTNSADLGGYTKVGVMGSSAGGHLASTIATHTDLADFQILLYPVITMDTATTHRGSHDFLLGKELTAEAELLYSNEKQVTRNTPEAFIALSLDDNVVPAVPNGLAYATALAADSVSTTLVCYPRGGHGWGWRSSFEFAEQWKAELAKFLFKK